LTKIAFLPRFVRFRAEFRPRVDSNRDGNMSSATVSGVEGGRVMMPEHGMEQVVAQLTQLAAVYHDDGERCESYRNLSQEVQALAERVKEYSLDGQSLNRLLFTRLHEELVGRYGPEAGVPLFGDVVKAFRG